MLVGGGLSIETRDWTTGGLRMSFMHDVSAESRVIVTNWISVVAVGALKPDDWSTSLEETAAHVIECFSTSAYFLDGTRKQLESTPMEVGGRPAHKIVAEVLVPTVPGVKGDVVTVVVVDTEADDHGFFLSSATIDHQQNQLEVADSLHTLKLHP